MTALSAPDKLKPAGSPLRELLILAMPIIAMMVSRMLMGFIDFVMVSQLGTFAQAAISPAVLLVFTVACLGMGVGQAVQTFVSQADGRGEPREAGPYAWQILYVSAFAALVAWPVSATTPIWYGWIATVAGHDPEMARLEIAYAQIAVWSVPFTAASVGLDGFFLGIQRPRISLFAVVLSLVVNATGNYCLIFGKFGFPEMGIAGAALATVIGWAARSTVLAAAMLLGGFDKRYNTRRSMGPSLTRLRDLLRIGAPTSVQWLIDIGSWVVFLVVIVPPYGVAAIAASNVALQYMHMSFMPAVGLGIALCSQVGFAIGEGQPERAVERARLAMRLTGGYMGGIGVLFVCAGYPLMWLMSDNPAVIERGVLVLIGAAVFQVFDAMCITYMNALRGAGDTRWPAVAVFCCCWGIFVGGGVLVSRLLPWVGLLGPWVVCAVYIIILGLLMRWRWTAGPWRQIRLFRERPAAEAGPPDGDAGEEEAVAVGADGVASAGPE
ncbi:MAG: MATE family efflux transporter [Phycisphaerae bacterium]|jgi:MATE family multidrug resistance protein